MIKMFILPAVAVLAMSGVAHAQYTGPSGHKGPKSVAEVLKNPVDDQYVQLKGQLLRQVGNEKYIFSDGTGEIRVEIDNKLLTGPIDDKTTVIIRGEVEKEFLESPEIDVESVTRP
ncbi:MAG: NirD/YgiW/YdeI family stress tolerance protein [Asticcacaulis sp.]